MVPDRETLLSRIEELETQLHNSEETLEAIRLGEIDALVVGGSAEGPRVYTLTSTDQPYRVLIEQIQEGAVTLSEDGTVLYCNRRLSDLLGLPHERVVGRSLLDHALKDEAAAFKRLLCTGKAAVAREELTLITAAGLRVPVYVSLSPLEGEDGSKVLCGIVTDLTEQTVHLKELADANARLEGEIAERHRIESALRQSQKMEAVGQLTGGIAHDFNNLLTGITGNLEMLQTRIAKGRITEVDRYINAAQGAARRAAALTHRLLAFSRRQALDPKPTNVNRLIAGMEELVRRTVGPEITVETVAADGLWPTLVDPGLLENALLNLCINARDAMTGGGNIVIETVNHCFDERDAQERQLAPGQYVSLCVSDTGTGMPPEVAAMAFDPFFTTKPIGMGTGLGLSMIHGFTQQSGGQARIYSTEGEGTSVYLYLPRHFVEAADAELPAELTNMSRARDGETVLVVDDEPTVRLLIIEVLQDLGYTSIEVADGTAALKVLESKVRIDLLVTDLGLPGSLNGRQVADAGRIWRPGLKVLFITGYAEHTLMHDDHLATGMQVLTKPFAIEALASRIKEIID